MDILEELKEEERNILLNILKKFNGKKGLFFEKSLYVIINVLLNEKDINNESIELICILSDDINLNKLNNISNVIFFLRPYFYEIENVFKIIEKIDSLETNKENKYCLIFIPYITYLCEEEILKYNISEKNIEIIIFPLYFFPVYNDVYSLELKNIFKEYYVHNDFTNIIFCSFSLLYLQFLFKGIFKNIKSIGYLSQFVSEQLISLRKEIISNNFEIQLPNKFEEDFYNFLNNINFQDIKSLKKKNETTAVPIKYALHKIFLHEELKRKEQMKKKYKMNKNKENENKREENNNEINYENKKDENNENSNCNNKNIDDINNKNIHNINNDDNNILNNEILMLSNDDILKYDSLNNIKNIYFDKNKYININSDYENEKKKKRKKKKEYKNSKIMKNFMTKINNTKYLMNKKDREKIEEEENKKKNYILEKLGIKNFDFLLKTSNQINTCIIIDRKIDMITPFCTPFTYEGLIDNFFSIENLQIEIPRYILFNDLKNEKIVNNFEMKNNKDELKVRVKLREDIDVLYNDIKNLNQNDVGLYLHKKANEIKETYKEKNDLKDIEQINKYMRKFKVKQYEHNSLSTHVNIATFIQNTIKTENYFNKLKLEDDIIQLNNLTNKTSILKIIKEIKNLIYKNEDIYEVYRILCLFCEITNGYNETYLNEIKKDIIEQYGINEIIRLNNLFDSNIIRCSNKKFQWNHLKNHLNLLTTKKINDISYVCNGYAPLTVRLIEYMDILKHNIHMFPEIFNYLNGATLDIIQNSIGYQRTINNENEKKKYVILFYIAGITYAEIAAIRKLNQISDNSHYLIFTTEIINSKKIVQSMYA